VQPPTKDSIRLAVEIISQAVQVVPPDEEAFDNAKCGEVAEAILSIIARHPINENDLRKMLARWDLKQVDKTLGELDAMGRAQVEDRKGIRFWSAAVSRSAK